ncbi:hypothetical protein C8R44DRAFT_846541 [Mycena epipterygia]|nr:hypothetical protein C8R44DRAFT_846541 [Mycena epipterygia]
MLPILPTKVLEAVIDASNENRRTLAACGAVGRQLLFRSRRHLFAHLHLGSPRPDITRHRKSRYLSGPTRCDIFWVLLRTNPSLAGHVEELELFEDWHEDPLCAWMTISTTLLPVAKLLSNLRRLAVRCGANGSSRGQVVVETVWACIQNPSICCVELAGLSRKDTLALFTTFTGNQAGRTLSCLRLSSTVFLGSVPLGIQSVTRETDNSLTVDCLDLSVKSDSSFEQHFVHVLSSRPLLNMSRLRHLRLKVGDGAALISQWLTLCAPAITQLDLRFIGWDWSWISSSTSDGVPLTPHLKLLRFEIYVAGAMDAILTILRMLRAHDITDMVFLSGRGQHFHTALSGLEFDAQWSALDSLIAGNFPRLNGVRFEAGRASRPEEWGPLLQERLPILDNSGLLIA